MKKYFAFILLAAGSIVLQSGCKRAELLTYSAPPAVNFTGKTVEYSFLGNASGEYIQEIPVGISGTAASHDRSFTAVVIDSSTTASLALFEMMGGTVPAGSFTGTYKVKLRNDSSLRNQRVAIKIKLADDTDFAAGNIETSEYTVQWSDQIVVPAWTYFKYFFTAQPSTKAYQLIVQTTGLKTLTAAEYRLLTPIGGEAMGRIFGDYVMQWNKAHPRDILKHDDGKLAGQPIVPLYYTQSIFE
ncbi:DUF4843 domain-containing protein [Chitinophaga sp. MM2321]|uniref:DUF4843 domain-containing protein n=1 Tax=Chitinophaga sp. MM2321 TaxID=3137178 RepID=UPI0032D58269